MGGGERRREDKADDGRKRRGRLVEGIIGISVSYDPAFFVEVESNWLV